MRATGRRRSTNKSDIRLSRCDARMSEDTDGDRNPHMIPTRDRAGFVRKILAAVLAAALSLGGSLAFAETDTLNVAVYDLAPYGGVNPDGSFTGASVDLWRRVAETAGLRYRFIAVQKMDAILTGLRDRTFDAAIGAITIDSRARGAGRFQLSGPWIQASRSPLDADQGSLKPFSPMDWPLSI